MRLFLAGIALCFALEVNAQAQTIPPSSKSYSFAVVPQQSAKKLAASWGPLLNYLTKKTGISLSFKTAKNIPVFEKQLAEGKYDFAYMNPYHFVVFNESPQYQAIAARIDQPISGILVAKKGGAITSLNDLDNSNVAFPSPAAFAASILSQAALKNADLTYNPRYVSSHDSVYLAVAKGLMDAGGGVKRTLNNIPQAVRDKLSIIWESKKHTPHAFAVHPRINQEIKNKIQQALVEMVNDETGKKILRSLKIKHGLKASKNEDWDDIRELNIELIN